MARRPNKAPVVLNEFQKRVIARLEALGQNAFSVAETHGFTDRKFIYDIVNGRKRSVQGSNLIKLASALECDVEHLAGGQGSPRLDAKERTPATVNVIGFVAAGLWVDSDLAASDAFDISPSPYPVDPRYPAEAQFDLIVRGTSINRFAREGQKLRCLSLSNGGRDWRDGEMVIVERYRGTLRERTAKRVRRTKGVLMLAPDSDDAVWQEPMLMHTLTGDGDGDRIVITAVVLYMYDTP